MQWPAQIAWEYRTEELKYSSNGNRLQTDELKRWGEEGWELVTVIPLPVPDEKGFFATTVAQMILKRPKERR